MEDRDARSKNRKCALSGPDSAQMLAMTSRPLHTSFPATMTRMPSLRGSAQSGVAQVTMATGPGWRVRGRGLQCQPLPPITHNRSGCGRLCPPRSGVRDRGSPGGHRPGLGVGRGHRPWSQSASRQMYHRMTYRMRRMAKTNSATSSAFVTGDTSGCMAPPTDPGATPDPAATPGGRRRNGK